MSKPFIAKNHEDEELLVQMVRSNPILWDMKHKDFKDSNKRMKVWNSISSALDRDADDCKRKWKNIRDYYHRRKRENKPPPMGRRRNASVSTRLSFLNGPSEKSEQARCGCSDSDDADSSHKNAFHGSASTEQANDDGGLSFTCSANAPITLDRLMAEVKKQSLTQCSQKEADPIDAFLQGISTSLKNLPPPMQIEAKRAIANCVYDIEAKCLKREKSPSVCST